MSSSPQNALLNDLGRVNNLNDPVPFLNDQGTILGIVVTFLILSSISAVGRLIIRLFVTRTPGIDDLFVAFSMLLNIAGGVVLWFMVTDGGLGTHFILMGLEGMSTFLRYLYIINSIYPISTTCIKLALLTQYLRILEKGAKLRRWTYVAIGLVFTFGLVMTGLAIVPCVPIYAFWDLSVPENGATRYGFGSHDINTLVATYIVHAAINMFLDLLVFSIPLPLWLSRAIDQKTRIALLCLFVLGAIVNVCSVFRLTTLVDNRAGTSPTLDPSWYDSAPIVLSVIEVHLATICASLPVFWPILKDSFSSWRITVTREVQITREAREVDEENLTYNIRKPERNSQPWLTNRASPYGPKARLATTKTKMMVAEEEEGEIKSPALVRMQRLESGDEYDKLY